MDEKFRKKLLISSRVIAVLLVIAIFWVGYVQMVYAKDVNALKAQYGDHAYCYLCGLESARTCGCIYEQDILGGDGSTSAEDRKIIAEANVEPCLDLNKDLTDGELEDMLKNLNLSNNTSFS